RREPRALRTAAPAGAGEHRRHRVARPRPSQQLGRRPSRRASQAGDARVVPMSKPQFRRSLPLVVVVASFAAGVLVDGWLRTYGPPKPAANLVADPVMTAAPRSSNAPARTASSGAGATVGTMGGVSTGHLRVPIDGVDIES